MNQSFGVFLAYYIENDRFPGATNLQYAFIGGLSISCALLISPLVTYITRTFGTKYTLGLGVILETISFIGASFASRTWHLFLSQGVCFGFGMGLLFLGSVGIIPQWFVKRRGLANALGSSGSGIGGLVYNLAVQAMLKSVGLAWTFRILAIIVFVTCVFSTIIIRDRNKAIGASQMVFDVTLFKRIEYLMMLAWGFLSILGLIVLLFSLPNYANYIGLTPSQGAVVGAVLNLGQGVGRPIVGFASDKTGKMNGAGFFTFLTGLFCLVVWIFAKSYGVLIFFALIVGLVCGTFWATIAPVAAEIVGLKHLASALSINWLVLVIPATGEFSFAPYRQVLLLNFLQFPKQLLCNSVPLAIFTLKSMLASFILARRSSYGLSVPGSLDKWRWLPLSRVKSFEKSMRCRHMGRTQLLLARGRRRASYGVCLFGRRFEFFSLSRRV